MKVILTASQKKSRLERGRARQMRFVKMGLRTDGKPRKGRKPCGCLFGSCLKCAKTTNKLIIMPALINAMYADYQAGMSLEAVGRKYPLKNGKVRAHGEVSQLFKRRGLTVRTWTRPKLGYGVRIPEPTREEIQKMISELTRLVVPVELKIHWRRWSFKKRQDWIRLARKKFPSNRPTTPFSKNVQPFVYGDENVHAIAGKINGGKNSQISIVKLKIDSEGVIYKGQIFYWDSNDSYLKWGAWTEENSRELLTHFIWREITGKPVPPQTLVIQKDGNKNNFEPDNLKLFSMADNARRNQVFRRLKLDPDNSVLKAKAQYVIERSHEGRRVKLLARARAGTAALLNPNSLLATLNRRKS